MSTYLTIERGDDETLDITVTNQDTGAVVDLTGATLKWMTKRRRNDADVDALITAEIGTGITVTNAAGGVAEVAIAAANTNALTPGAYYWELQSVDAAGKVHTLVRDGRIVIMPDLIRSTP